MTAKEELIEKILAYDKKFSKKTKKNKKNRYMHKSIDSKIVSSKIRRK